MKSRSFWSSDMFLKILALGIIGVLLTAILKKHCSELLPLMEIAIFVAGIIIIGEAGVIKRSGIEKIFSAYSASGDLLPVVLKGAAVAVITRLSCDVCRESGNSLVADIVELGGRIMLIILAMPFVEKVTEIALSFYE